MLRIILKLCSDKNFCQTQKILFFLSKAIFSQELVDWLYDTTYNHEKKMSEEFAEKKYSKIKFFFTKNRATLEIILHSFKKKEKGVEMPYPEGKNSSSRGLG